MGVASRGVRNTFRNATRTVAIMLILGLAIGLAVVMLIAHRAVGEKTSTTLSSIGNTVTIGPPGYSAGGQLGTFLTSAELAPDRAPARGHGHQREPQRRGEGPRLAAEQRDGHWFAGGRRERQEARWVQVGRPRLLGPLR